MEFSKIPLTGLLINHIKVKAPPVDTYIIKDGYVMAKPLKEKERRDLRPVGEELLEKEAFIRFQEIGKKPTEKNVLSWVNRFGLPLPGDHYKQPFEDIKNEAVQFYKTLKNYNDIVEKVLDRERQYMELYDIAALLTKKIERVTLDFFGLQDSIELIGNHHAEGLTVIPTLCCPDLISYLYLRLYKIATLREKIKECIGCGCIFPPERDGDFHSERCYKAWWKRQYDLAKARRLWQEGKNIEDIAKEVKKSAAWVKRKVGEGNK